MHVGSICTARGSMYHHLCICIRSDLICFLSTGTISCHLYSGGVRIACWLERRTRDRKVASSNLGRSGGRIFFSRVNFVCWLLFGVRSTRVLPQWHVKKPSHSAKSAGGRLHLTTRTPLTQWRRSGLTVPLPRHSVGSYRETSSHATRQGKLGHSRLSSLSHCGLILALRVELAREREK